MTPAEEVIDAVIGPDGDLRLSHAPQTPPGPVRVTIRSAAPVPSRRTLTDVVREIRAAQDARGFRGLTAEELQRREQELRAEDDEYDQLMERQGAMPATRPGAG